MFDNERIYTIEEVAEIMKVHKTTIKKKVKEGTIASIDIGTKDKPMYRITGKALNDFIS